MSLDTEKDKTDKISNNIDNIFVVSLDIGKI